MMQEISNYIGIFLGLLSIAATIYFARRYSEKKLPKYSYQTQRKIQQSVDTPDDIEIFYKGAKVKSIFSTTLWFWNDGRKPILKSDIPSTQPLVAKLSSSSDLEILDLNILKVSREAIDIKVKKITSCEFNLSFDFLDHNDGVVVEVLHSGEKGVKLDFSGAILGSPQGIMCASGSSGHSFDFFDILVPVKRKRENSLLHKMVFTILITAIFGGLTYFVISIPAEITTTKELLSKSLADYVGPSNINAAIEAVSEESKYKFIQNFGPYIMASIFMLNLIFGYWVTWVRNNPYPKTIDINDSTKRLGSESAGIEQVAAQDSAAEAP